MTLLTTTESQPLAGRAGLVSAVGLPCVRHLLFMDFVRGRGSGFQRNVSVFWPGGRRTSFVCYYIPSQGLT